MNNFLEKQIIPYNTQYTDKDDLNGIINLFNSGNFLTCGPKVKEFENAICNYTGSKYSVAVSNGTAALHIVCLTIGLSKGDEVIVPAISFAASSNCVLYTGATPIFCDVEEDTLNIDCDKIEKLITKNTQAIIAVDMGGMLCDYHRLRNICNKYNLILIEDAAHSFGIKETKCKISPYVGSFADFTTFSFHPVKNITTGEGGMVMTNNKEYYELLKKYRSHGMTRDFKDRENSNNENKIPGHEYDIDCLGYNYRMTDIQAVLGLSQLKKIEMFMEKRNKLAKYYLNKIKQFTNIKCLNYKFNSANHLFIIKIKNGKRNELYNELKQNKIYCNVHYKPIYLFSYYQELGYKKGLCPVAENVYEEILSLPIYFKLEYCDIDYILNIIKKYLN
jgi:perosamine synthetase